MGSALRDKLPRIRGQERRGTKEKLRFDRLSRSAGSTGSECLPIRAHEFDRSIVGRKDADRKIGGPRYLLIPLLSGVETWMARFGRDGKSFLYPVTSGSEITFYRQGWRDGQLIGNPQVALKLPFAFHQAYQGNAYDFSRDLNGRAIVLDYGGPTGIYVTQRNWYFAFYTSLRPLKITDDVRSSDVFWCRRLS
jgi:hypothetical protein